MMRLQSHYFGSLFYWSSIVQNKEVVIDVHEHFEKQSYRNRAMILGANGAQTLIVPIHGRNKKQAFGDVRISYDEPWLRVHLNTLQSAYRSAPYFEYIYPEIETILCKKHTLLIELNQDLLFYIIKRLKLDIRVQLSGKYDLFPTEQEARHMFHPKLEKKILPAYPQVFQEKFGFVPGMGIIDLLMNDLSGASHYLRQLALH